MAGKEIDFTESDKILETMEYVEKKKDREKYDAIFVVALILVVLSSWIIIYSLWIEAGQPIKRSLMVDLVEIVGIFMFVAILSFTDFKITDVGIRFKNIKWVMFRAALITVITVVVLVAVKMILISNDPSKFADKPFWNTSRVTINYLVTAIIQELLCRGIVQETFYKIFSPKNIALKAILVTSLFFAALHVYFDFTFAMGAFALSIMLGILYNKDRSIWGCFIVHFFVGGAAMMLSLV